MDQSPASELKKVLVVFGTRPEAIKMAPVVHRARQESRLQTVVCATGQHREMLDQMLDVFHIRPDYSLEVMRPAQTLAQVTTALLDGMDQVLAREKPDVVLVQGDTTTTFATSLAAFYQRVPVGHVEAGLRTGDKFSPFPEEINRRLATHVADYHFAPTTVARDNLMREGIGDEQILVTGNTVIDALLYMRQQLAENPVLLPQFVRDLPRDKRFILVTAHRRESFGEQMAQICRAIRSVALSRPDVVVIYPVHLNPNVQQPVRAILEGIPNLRLMEPQDYVAFVALMERADILLTDSGGIQEEGPSLGKPVLVMRPVSERPEAIAAGTACLVGTDPARITSAVNRLLDDSAFYQQMTRRSNPYGDGHAAERIVNFLLQKLFANSKAKMTAATSTN